ncbi:MAG: UvrD-helicase domain-containing protein, partial [Planctomycetota bacterium]
AVTTTEGPLLILAAAGSGKTRVLTRRVAWLVHQGIEPSSILAITFTNKAAGEMRERVRPLIEDRVRMGRDIGRLDTRGPLLCTFHSLCLRILRHYGDILGVPRNFNILDSADQSKMMKQALKELDVSSTNFPPAKVLAMISNAKNALASAEEFAREASDFYQRTVARAYLKYDEMMRKNESLDFDDLLLRVVQGLRDRPDVLKELQDRFAYLHIDEYQDTNRVQYVLAHVLAERHKNLCVVGDPDQSIYAWRGADLRNILDFEQDYPQATVVKLETNYRSTATILKAADVLIKNNVERKDKGLVAHAGEGEKIDVLACQDEQDEAREVAERLIAFKKEGRQWSDMAVFYRMNALSRVIETALRRENVPYQIARGTEFYNRKEVKDTLAYLRAIHNPSDEVSLLRIVNTPTRGIGDASVKAMQAFAIAEGVGVFDAMKRVDEITGVSSRGKGSVALFVEKIEAWQRHAAQAATGKLPDDAPAADDLFVASEDGADVTLAGLVAKVIRQSGLEKHYTQPGDDEQPQVENMNELVNAAAEYEEGRREENEPANLGDFLQQIALVSDTDRFEGNGGAVTLMTLHAAKGLEFPVVAMLGLEEGCLPHSRARDSQQELEEERRLAFVGITRAQERLMLSRAQYRTMRGVRERTVPSPFLKELPDDTLIHTDRTGLAGLPSASMIDQPADDLSSRFRVGMKIRHTKLGVGKVLDLSAGRNARIVIDFARGGRKTLVLDIAASKLAPAG